MSNPKPSIQWRREPVRSDKHSLIFDAKVVGGSCLGYGDGKLLTLRVIKQSHHEQGVRYSENDIQGHRLAMHLCEEFNKLNFTNKKVYAIPGRLFHIDYDYKDSSNTLVIAKNQLVMVEERIQGNYEHFTCNFGCAQHDALLPSFLGHWSWVHSKGKYILCNLQGLRAAYSSPPINESTHYYRFANPAIISREHGKFGYRDHGEIGMREWFSNHKCNELCNVHGFSRYIPKTLRDIQTAFEDHDPNSYATRENEYSCECCHVQTNQLS